MFLGQGFFCSSSEALEKSFPSVSGCAGARAALASHPTTSLLLLLKIIMLIRWPLIVGVRELCLRAVSAGMRGLGMQRVVALTCPSPARGCHSSVSQPVRSHPLSPLPVAGSLLLSSLPCTWAAGLNLGFVRHEVEVWAICLSTLAAILLLLCAASAADGDSSDGKGTFILPTQAVGRPWLLGQAGEKEAAGQ